jgi:armadillo repeat-containing protein 1
VKAAALCDVIAKTKIMWAEQVVKKQTGEEVTLSFGAHPPIQKTKPEQLPDYLPEDEPLPAETSDKAVSRLGETQSQKGSSWLTSVGSFLAKSFYW